MQRGTVDQVVESSGLECRFYDVKGSGWYYLLQGYNCPAEAWDWREYATAYGPFSSEEAAIQHLDRNHANPGTDALLDQKLLKAKR